MGPHASVSARCSGCPDGHPELPFNALANEPGQAVLKCNRRPDGLPTRNVFIQRYRRELGDNLFGDFVALVLPLHEAAGKNRVTSRSESSAATVFVMDVPAQKARPGDIVDPKDPLNHPHAQDPRIGDVNLRADNEPGVDIEHHVAGEVLARTGPASFGMSHVNTWSGPSPRGPVGHPFAARGKNAFGFPIGSKAPRSFPTGLAPPLTGGANV